MKRVAWIGAVAGLGYAVSLFGSWRPVWVGWVHDIVPVLVPAGAAVACWHAALHADPRARASWTLFGVGAAAWAAGDTAYTVLTRLGTEPAGALTGADIGYLALIPAWGIALTLHPARARRRLDLLGSAIEAVVVLVAASAVTSAYVLQPIVKETGDFAGAAVNLAYPIGDLVLMGAFAALLARSEVRALSAEGLIAAAVVIFAAGDILFARLALTNSYETGSPVDLTWIAAFLALALASRRGLQEHERVFRDAGSHVPLLSIGGLLALGAIGACALVSRDRPVLLVGAVMTGLLIVARQGIMLDERRRLLRDLAVTVTDLETSNRQMDDFLTTVSHDLRAPLSAIKGFSELLVRSGSADAPGRVADCASAIVRNAERLRRLVEDLLAAGQFAAGTRPTLEMEPVELLGAADQAARDLGSPRVEVDGRPVLAVADPTRLQQILFNLIGNALTHGGGDARVSVRVDARGDRARIAVSDDGPGIVPERLETIFDRFASYSSHRSSTGLGLYIVRKLSEAMGGEVGVHSEAGRGATFTVLLPLAPEDPRSERRAPLPGRSGQID
jgi:signal transduction histidine kinase